MAERSNLTVITRARATKILFDGKRATGIRYLHKNREQSVTARREVLLAAGAFGSPRLLVPELRPAEGDLEQGDAGRGPDGVSYRDLLG